MGTVRLRAIKLSIDNETPKYETLNNSKPNKKNWINGEKILFENKKEWINLRWVIKEKLTDGEKAIKARLLAGGFEEKRNFQTEDPKCYREELGVISYIISSKLKE